MTLLDRIKQLCEQKGETLASLERRMDFGNGTIRRWGDTTPSGDKLAKVADFFNVSVDYLLGRNTPSQEPIGLDSLYFSIAKDAQDNNVDPRDLQAIIDIVKRLKKET